MRTPDSQGPTATNAPSIGRATGVISVRYSLQAKIATNVLQALWGRIATNVLLVWPVTIAINVQTRILRPRTVQGVQPPVFLGQIVTPVLIRDSRVRIATRVLIRGSPGRIATSVLIRGSPERIAQNAPMQGLPVQTAHSA